MTKQPISPTMATMKRKAYEGPRPKGPTGRVLDDSCGFSWDNLMVDLDALQAMEIAVNAIVANHDLSSILVALRDKIQRINDERTHLLTNDPEPAEEVIYYLGRAIQHSRRMPGAKNANRE